MEQTISAGLTGRNASSSTPSRVAVAGAKLSTTTSAFAASPRIMSRPASDPRSSTALRFPRCQTR